MERERIAPPPHACVAGAHKLAREYPQFVEEIYRETVVRQAPPGWPDRMAPIPWHPVCALSASPGLTERHCPRLVILSEAKDLEVGRSGDAPPPRSFTSFRMTMELFTRGSS